MKRTLWQLSILIWLFCPALFAQEESRSDDIDAARAQKEQNLQPAEQPQLENVIVDAEHSLVYRWLTSTEGFGLGFGQMVPNSGFSLSLRYQKTLLGDHLRLGGYLDGSDRWYYKALFSASLANFLDGRERIDFDVFHSDYNQMPYYGPGPNSRKTGRSDYRLETTEVDIRPSVRPVKHLTLGLLGSLMAINVGPGTASQFISTDRQFSPSVAPGIQQQTSFLEGGAFVDYDWRNHIGDPTNGGQYHAEYAKLTDWDLGKYSFYRTSFDVRQYIPLFHGKRTIALHGASWFTDTGKGEEIPFHMQSTLGGPDSLRGFRPFRFYDNDAVLVQGEYRWEASSVLDLALFADGGKVFHDWDQWSLHGIQGDFGFGLRFKTQSKVAFRIDTAFSHEGFQVCFRAHNPF